MKLTIVVPCYNEAENIPLILKRFSEVIKDNNIEVILINNGSTDNSAEVIEELLPKYPFARTVLVPVNQGYGYGIIQGLKTADGDYIGWTHADMQTDPNDVVRAYKYICKHEGERLYIKGGRSGRPLLDTLFTNGMSFFETLYFRMPMNDINAQPNIFPKDFPNTWEDPPYDFMLDLYAFYTARKQGMKMVRFPVRFTERLHGQSNWNTGKLNSKMKFIKRIIGFSKEIRQREKEAGK